LVSNICLPFSCLEYPAISSTGLRVTKPPSAAYYLLTGVKVVCCFWKIKRTMPISLPIRQSGIRPDLSIRPIVAVHFSASIMVAKVSDCWDGRQKENRNADLQQDC
jgi:hypothetical protein